MGLGKYANDPTLAVPLKKSSVYPSPAWAGQVSRALLTGDTTETSKHSDRTTRCPWAERKPGHHTASQGPALSDLQARAFIRYNVSDYEIRIPDYECIKQIGVFFF